MYYLELIERFWKFNRIAKISPVEISLYLYLIKLGNDNNRYDFKIADKELGVELNLSRTTIRSTKKKLKKAGLLQFQSSNSYPCHYRLLLDYPLEIPSHTKTSNENTKKSDLYKPALAKITPRIEHQNIKNGDVPSLDEFIEYSRTLEGYESYLDLFITEKYESWISKGWKNTSNRPISNWKLTLKSALPYMKNSNEVNPISLQDIPNIKHPLP